MMALSDGILPCCVGYLLEEKFASWMFLCWTSVGCLHLLLIFFTICGPRIDLYSCFLSFLILMSALLSLSISNLDFGQAYLKSDERCSLNLKD